MYLYIQPNKCNLFDEQMIYVLVLFRKSEIYSTISQCSSTLEWLILMSQFFESYSSESQTLYKTFER